MGVFNFKFSKNDTPEIRRLIISDLRKIIGFIKNGLPDTKVIILGGSFSRGEGSILMRGKSIYSFSDYDIIVVTNRFHPLLFFNLVLDQGFKNKIFRFRQELNIPKVGFSFVWKNFFGRLGANTHFMYDLKSHGKLLYGNANILKTIHTCGIDEISETKGIELLWMAYNMLIGAAPINNRDSLDHQTFDYLCIRSALSSTMAYLVFNHDYSPAYGERSKTIMKKYSHNFTKDELKFLKKSLDFKLTPRPRAGRHNTQLWFKARNIANKVLENFFKVEKIGNNIENEIGKTFSYKLYLMYIFFSMKRIRPNIFTNPLRDMLCSSYYLSNSLHSDGSIDRNLLKKAEKFIFNLSLKKSNSNNLKKRFLWCRNEALKYKDLTFF